uniref:ZSWIM7 n=1 Tax=Macrostomum lignano TaxID=282301 RepID=A0A1I8FCI5_9PLAT
FQAQQDGRVQAQPRPRALLLSRVRWSGGTHEEERSEMLGKPPESLYTALGNAVRLGLSGDSVAGSSAWRGLQALRPGWPLRLRTPTPCGACTRTG